MSASHITIVVGDTAPPLRATLGNASGPQDLTGAAVVARLKPSTGGAVIEVTMDIETPATSGVVSHEWDPSETDEALKYTVEFVVTFADETVETFPNVKADVSTVTIRKPETA